MNGYGLLRLGILRQKVYKIIDTSPVHSNVNTINNSLRPMVIVLRFFRYCHLFSLALLYSMALVHTFFSRHVNGFISCQSNFAWCFSGTLKLRLFLWGSGYGAIIFLVGRVV